MIHSVETFRRNVSTEHIIFDITPIATAAPDTLGRADTAGTLPWSRSASGAISQSRSGRRGRRRVRSAVEPLQRPHATGKAGACHPPCGRLTKIFDLQLGCGFRGWNPSGRDPIVLLHGEYTIDRRARTVDPREPVAESESDGVEHRAVLPEPETEVVLPHHARRSRHFNAAGQERRPHKASQPQRFQKAVHVVLVGCRSLFPAQP